MKVTILATGFGVKDIDGMDSHIGRKVGQEEADRLAREQERAAELATRREEYYGGRGSNNLNKRRPHLFLFNPEDLDNEDVIQAVEDTPTNKRTRQMLTNIRNIANGGKPTDGETQQEQAPGVISFA